MHARAITSLEGRTAAMRRGTAATTGPTVFQHFARLAQVAPAPPHPALAGDVASEWVKQTDWRTARQRAISTADGATTQSDPETAEHRVRHSVHFCTLVVAVTGRSWPSHPSLFIEYLEELADDITCSVSLPSWLASLSMPRSLPPQTLLSYVSHSTHCGVHTDPDGPLRSVCGSGTGSASALGMSPSLVALSPLSDHCVPRETSRRAASRSDCDSSLP